jgi:hypothetical protein
MLVTRRGQHATKTASAFLHGRLPLYQPPVRFLISASSMITYSRPPKRAPKPRPPSPPLVRIIVTNKSPAELQKAKRIHRQTTIKL